MMLREINEFKNSYIPLLKDFKMSYDNLPQTRTYLGSGGSGTAYRVHMNEQDVVLKYYHPEAHAYHTFFPEAFLMSQIQSPYVVKLKAILYSEEDAQPPAITMKYYPTTLKQRLEHKDAVSLEQLYQWGMQLSEGLAAIHEKGWLHKDLRSNNIFLDEKSHAVIGDLGEASPQSSSKIATRNWRYSAPELMEQLFTQEFATGTTYSDVYSLGVLFWEMVTHKAPFRDDSHEQIIIKKYQSIHEKIPSECPSFLKQVIEACWNNDPSKRPSAQALRDQFAAALLELNKKDSMSTAENTDASLLAQSMQKGGILRSKQSENHKKEGPGVDLTIYPPLTASRSNK